VEGRLLPSSPSTQENKDGQTQKVFTFADLEGKRVGTDGKLRVGGRVVAKLTSGDRNICAGKKANAHGQLLDTKGNMIGKLLLLELPSKVSLTDPLHL
jgi:hypothetical protein